MAEFIAVMGAKVDDRVVIWEVHPDHPDGEIFVAGNGRAVQVALTSQVQSRLNDRTLVQVQTASTGSATGAAPEPVDPTPFADYDTLNVDAVIARLATLTDEEKAAVRLYEAAHKNRKTVLEALG